MTELTPTAEIIRQLLIDLDLGESSGSAWTVFVSFLPTSPDQAIAVYDTAALSDGRLMGTGERIEHPGFQIRVRGSNYPDVRNKADEIALALDTQQNTSVTTSDGTFEILNISRLGGLIHLGIDETDQRRHHITINAVTTIRKTV